MRFLASFFSCIFVVITPYMLSTVFSEMNFLFINQLPPHITTPFFEKILLSIKETTEYSDKMRSLFLWSKVFVGLLHFCLTVLFCYGSYTSRPSFVKPIIVDTVISTLLLLTYVCSTLAVYMALNGEAKVKDKDFLRIQLRNCGIGSAFLIAYFVHLAVTLVAYRDVCQIHADFMYWIVEERQSMKSRHNVSIDNSLRSNCSSKGSRGSRLSNRSAKAELWAHSRPNSVTASIGVSSGGPKPGNSRMVNARLSVPL